MQVCHCSVDRYITVVLGVAGAGLPFMTKSAQYLPSLGQVQERRAASPLGGMRGLHCA